MGSTLSSLQFDAHDPERLAAFWGGLLGRQTRPDEHSGDVVVLPHAEHDVPLVFVATSEARWGLNQMHFDLTSASLAEQQQTVERALALGGRHFDVGQTDDEPHVVLADPEGNEFCVIEAGNNFLADTAQIGAFSCDGSQAVGYFWAAALDWPLVWDHDEETAIQSPQGGTKISWGGPPVSAKLGKNRLRLELRVDDDADAQVEIARLVSLGASRIGAEQRPAEQRSAERVMLADPDGNEFCVSFRQ